ncbi:MAG: hypothetical protein JXB03_02570, partial [Spirochaetales bacterium]|nr:hypothetical protein [Spirochaetales bacterium]
MQKKLLLVLAGIVASFQLVFSQVVSEKKELALFSLSYYGWDIPQPVLGAVDDAVKDVFVNIGRFSVIGMSYRLDADDVNDFIGHIKRFKEQQLEIPESVRLGEETFTEADFNRITGSFLVVIPTVSFYSNDYNEDDDQYEAELQTGFTFINIETYETVAFLSISTIGSGDTALEAAKDAADYIPLQLAFEVKSVDEFKLKTGVLEITGNRVLLELGKDMGIKVG